MNPAEFAAWYGRQRGALVPRSRMATRLGITTRALGARYRRAVATGLITPDTQAYRDACASAASRLGHARRRGITRDCADCGTDAEETARGLCQPCYERHRRQKTLSRFPRVTRPTSDFAEDYAVLRGRGLTRRQIGEHLGMSVDAVQAAYSRALRKQLLTPDSPAYRAHVEAVIRHSHDQRAHRWRPAA
jgi:hypothetical protein